MKRLSWAGLPHLLFVLTSGCSKTSDLSNKTRLHVNLIQISNTAGEATQGSEIVLRRLEDGDMNRLFATIPASVVFTELQPGAYTIHGEHSFSIDTIHLELQQNEEKKVILQFP